MKKVRFIAVAGIVFLTASLLVSSFTPAPAEVEAVECGFTVVATPTPTPIPTPTLTPTPTATPTYSPGGGDGGGDGEPIELDLVIDGSLTLWQISSGGVLMQDVYARSPDGILEVHIPKGTRALTVNYLPLREISIARLTVLPAPPKGYSVLCAFEFEPDGASFDPAFTAEVTISAGMLPSGFTGSSLAMAYSHDDAGEWDFISGAFDPETREFTFLISHFTVFAVLMPSGATPTPTPTPVPPPTSVEGTSLTGLWAALGVVLGAGIIFLLFRRRRRKQQVQGG